MKIHFFHFDERFCGSTDQPRAVAADAAGVTCEDCRRKACAGHELHEQFLSHVADYCPDCEQPFAGAL